MRLIRRLLVVVVLVWLVAEFAAIPFAEQQVEHRVSERTNDVGSVRVDIDSFPLVSRALLTGRVSALTVTLDEVVRRSVTYAQVRFDLRGIRIDRDAALRGRPQVTAIDTGTVTATIELSSLGPLVGHAASVAGSAVSVRAGRLHIGPVSVAIPFDVMPCPPDARIEGELIVLSCIIDEVPDPLVEAAQS